MEAMQSQQTLQMHEASVMIKSAFADYVQATQKLSDKDLILHVLQYQSRQVAKFDQHMAQLFYHRTLSLKNKHRLNQAMRFRSVDKSWPKQRLTIPNTTNFTLILDNQMLQIFIAYHQLYYKLSSHGSYKQLFSLFKTKVAAELSSSDSFKF